MTGKISVFEPSAEVSPPRLEILSAEPETERLLPNESRIEEWHDDRGEICMWSADRDGRPCLVAPGLALFELHGNRVLATPFRSGVERVVEDTYWRSVLPLFMQYRGAQALHASAVLGPVGVVGFCGRAGAGKSTLAYGLSMRGYRLWADDALVLTAVDPPQTIALEGEVRLLPDVRDHLGLAPDRIDVGAKPGDVAELDALIVLGIGAGEAKPAHHPLEPGDAFAALVEHAYVYGFEDGKRKMSEFFLALADAVPAHEIVRSAGLDGLATTLDLVEELIR